MPSLDPVEVVRHAKAAGFRYGKGLDVIVAIAFAETGGTLDPATTNTAGNKPPSTDRGLLGINSHWHPEVADACAFEPACAFREAYRISRQGTRFSQWATFNNGRYRYYMPAAQLARRLEEMLAGAVKLVAERDQLAWALGSLQEAAVAARDGLAKALRAE